MPILPMLRIVSLAQREKRHASETDADAGSAEYLGILGRPARFFLIAQQVIGMDR